jgi:hypothetical protein
MFRVRKEKIRETVKNFRSLTLAPRDGRICGSRAIRKENTRE